MLGLRTESEAGFAENSGVLSPASPMKVLNNYSCCSHEFLK